MLANSLNLILLIGLFHIQGAKPACSPVEEGHSTRLTCEINTSTCSGTNFDLQWIVRNKEVTQCNKKVCGGRYVRQNHLSATITPTRSELTVNRATRSERDPFNMETKWECRRCSETGASVTACDKLQIYAVPESPSCTVSEETESGDIKSVNVSCSTSKVYPKARCRFYNATNGDNSVEIPTNPVYSHTPTGETPVYYRSQCSVSVPVQELGEGTHRFIGYIYPNVTNGFTKVIGTPADKTVILSFSQASHSCRPQAVQGYFQDKSTTCTCSLSSDGHPRGTAQWYKDGQLVGSSGTLVVTHDKSNPEQIYTCEAVSDLGQRVGSTLTAKFAYVPEVTFTLDPAQTTFSKGDNLELKCSGEGNPDPTLTLATKETTDNLTNVQTKELTHTFTLDCMDTGVYVCSGENIQGTNRTEISIGVHCPQQLSPLFNSKPEVDVIIRETAKFGIEIYGFPEPSTLTLQKTDDDTDLMSSPRHFVQYTARVAPFGVVNVTISDVVEADYTNYTLTIDNGVGSALNYTFYLNEVNVTKEASSGDDNDIYIIVGICVGLAVLILVAVAVAVVVLYRRKNKSGKSAENGSILKEPDYEEKINEVYGASNDVKSKAENGDVFRKSDIDLKQNPVYVSSGEAQENGVAQRESDCVMKENIVYGTSSEAQDGDRNEVIHKNPVYGSPFPYPGRKGTVKQSRDYTQLEPTITSASAAPANMKMAPPENDADPYEDVGNVKKSKSLGKSKQSVAPKPSSRDMAPQKPGSSPTFQVQQVGSSDELYAMVSLTNKGNKRTATPEPDEEEQDKDFLPDPSTRPDVPVKQFEEGDAHARGSDIPEQPYGNFQSVQAETSESDKSHTNGSFLPDETEDNVYANTGAVGMRS